MGEAWEGKSGIAPVKPGISLYWKSCPEELSSTQRFGDEGRRRLSR